jgi:DNA-binding transcriptional ArsR family regulator
VAGVSTIWRRRKTGRATILDMDQANPTISAEKGEGCAPPLDSARMLESARHASDYLKALAHENRLMLLCLLGEKERTVSELESLLALRQPAVSQQLARLRLEGLVQTRRDGKAVYYRLADEDTRALIRLIYDKFCKA